jgi:two-component system response regulator AdeR
MLDKGLILIVEDEPAIASILEAYLIRDGFRTVSASDGEIALRHHSMLSPDLILLDVKMPKYDGFEVLARIRRDSNIPVIMVSALAEDLDRLSGLSLGADDYVIKPFNPQEVVARVNAVLRRTRNNAANVAIRFENILVDFDAHAAFTDTGDERQLLPLTLSEFRILAHMIRRPSHAFPRNDLLDACLPQSDALVRTIDTHIANLRRKIEASGGPSGLFPAVRGIGYRLAEPR